MGPLLTFLEVCRMGTGYKDCIYTAKTDDSCAQIVPQLDLCTFDFFEYLRHSFFISQTVPFAVGTAQAQINGDGSENHGKESSLLEDREALGGSHSLLEGVRRLLVGETSGPFGATVENFWDTSRISYVDTAAS